MDDMVIPREVGRGRMFVYNRRFELRVACARAKVFNLLIAEEMLLLISFDSHELHCALVMTEVKILKTATIKCAHCAELVRGGVGVGVFSIFKIHEDAN